MKTGIFTTEEISTSLLKVMTGDTWKIYFELYNYPLCKWLNNNNLTDLFFQSKSRLKKKIENNSSWEGSFYQSGWVKISSSWDILDFSLYVC